MHGVTPVCFHACVLARTATQRVAVLELHALWSACAPAVVCAQLGAGEKLRRVVALEVHALRLRPLCRVCATSRR